MVETINYKMACMVKQRIMHRKIRNTNNNSSKLYGETITPVQVVADSSWIIEFYEKYFLVRYL